MPEKYVRRSALPLLVRHTGSTTLPEAPPFGQARGRSRASGPDVICLHDAGLSSSVFDDLLGELEGADVHALAFDLPAHGRSGSLDSLPSIGAMAELAAWLCGACEVTRPIVVGHGMGALIALEWASTEPDSLSGLVLCGAGSALGVDAEKIEAMRNVTRGKAPRPFDPTRVCKDGGREMIRRAYMEGLKTDPRATLVDLEAMREWAQTDSTEPPEARWGATGPIRIVCGSAEGESERSRSQQLADRAPTATLAVVEGAAHFVPLEQPGALAREIEACRAECAEAS